MWRTVLYKEVRLLRNSSIYGSSRIFSDHVAGHECNDGRIRRTVKDRQSIVSNRNVASAESAIIGLLLKLHDGNFNDKHPLLKVDGHVPLVQSLLDNVCGHTELPLSNRDADLTVCTPKTKRNGKGSGFGFKFIFQDFEKWCYGVVVVSSLISWHRLLFNNGKRNNTDFQFFHLTIDSEPPRILPVNSPAKPVDPLDAACSSIESTMADSVAVTENALAVEFSTFKLYEKAFTFFLSASKKGNVSAHFNVGVCYEKGLGTTQDISKAVCSYGVAASNGHQNAAFNLGLIFLEGKYCLGKDKYGLEMMEKAAIGGLVKAQRFLGLYYADDSNRQYDMKKSFQWLKMASEQDDAIAQYHLGICYERGLGVARNMQKAKDMYSRGAENGHAGAQYNYGVFYEQGLGGLSVDKHEALRWYSTAVENGNVNAEESVKSLQKERLEKTTPNLLERLPNLQFSKQPKRNGDVMPRCSSSPGRLFNMQSESSQSPQESQAGKQKSITYEDSKCIWVI